MAAGATCPVIHSAGLLSPAECGALSAVWHGFSPYRPSSDPRVEYRAPVSRRPMPAVAAAPADATTFEFDSSLAPRFDAGRNFVRTGGRFGRVERDATVSRSRTDYFRETYATRYLIFAPGIEFLLDSEPIAALAGQLYGLGEIVPFLVYANLLLPGQELGLHTDVPEFRLAPGTVIPSWLRVVMCHSGLFERWRVAVATVIVYLDGAAGGELAYFADGPDGGAGTITPGEGDGVVLDADNTFHGVDRVGNGGTVVPMVVPGSRLVHRGERRWDLTQPSATDAGTIMTFCSDQLRFSASWKGCCFEDAADRTRWETHSDDLPVGGIIGRLRGELEERGRVSAGAQISNDELGSLLVDEFVRFPGADTTHGS